MFPSLTGIFETFKQSDSLQCGEEDELYHLDILQIIHQLAIFHKNQYHTKLDKLNFFYIKKKWYTTIYNHLKLIPEDEFCKKISFLSEYHIDYLNITLTELRCFFEKLEYYEYCCVIRDYFNLLKPELNEKNNCKFS